MKAKTGAELNTLAVDIFHGRVFTDRHTNGTPQEIQRIFPVILFLKYADLKKFTTDLGMIYEYFDKAAPLGVNGNPMFFSCQRLSKTETKKVWSIYEKLKKAEQSVVGKRS